MARTGQFNPGQSGNPNGRGKGTVNKRSVTAAAIAKYNEKHQDSDALADIMSKMIDLAKDGDIQAAKLVLDRTEPTYKPISVPVDLGRLPKELFAKGEKILNLVSTGNISSDIARDLLSGINSLMTIKEKTELEERLTKLENAHATN